MKKIIFLSTILLLIGASSFAQTSMHKHHHKYHHKPHHKHHKHMVHPGHK